MSKDPCQKHSCSMASTGKSINQRTRRRRAAAKVLYCWRVYTYMYVLITQPAFWCANCVAQKGAVVSIVEPQDGAVYAIKYGTHAPRGGAKLVCDSSHAHTKHCGVEHIRCRHSSDSVDVKAYVVVDPRHTVYTHGAADVALRFVTDKVWPSKCCWHNEMPTLSPAYCCCLERPLLLPIRHGHH